MEVVLLAAVHNKEKSCHLARPGIVGDRSHDINFHFFIMRMKNMIRMVIAMMMISVMMMIMR